MGLWEVPWLIASPQNLTTPDAMIQALGEKPKHWSVVRVQLEILAPIRFHDSSGRGTLVIGWSDCFGQNRNLTAMGREK